MDPISMLMMGTSLASGLTSFLGGNAQKKKAQEAAALQYQREKEARAAAEASGQAYEGKMTGYADAYDPYVQSGQTANTAYERLLQDPSSVRSLPGYNFLQEEGIGALDKSAGAKGMLKSGRGAKDLMRFSQGLADQTYGSQLDRLFRGSQAGQQAVGAQTGVLAQGSRGALDASMAGAGMGFRSAGTEPQGMVAGENAYWKGMEGLMGGINGAAGQAAGGGGLKSLMQNTSRSSSFGPAGSGTGYLY